MAEGLPFPPMMKSFRLPSLRASVLFATLGVALFSTAGAAPTYTVDFTTPWKIGQTYSASIKASEVTQTVLTMGGNKLQDQTLKRTARLEADAQALEVYPHGGLRKAAFVVRSFTSSQNGAPESTFLPPGAKIVATSTGVTEKEFTVNGRAATDEQKPVLELAISLDGEKHNDQILFGSKKPVTVGEQWTPDASALKETLGKGLGEIGSAQGTMRLDAIEGSGPTQIAVVSGTVDFSGIKPELPPGITPKSGTFRAVLDGRIPASRTAVKRVENLTANAEFSGEAPAPDGSKVTFLVKVEAKHGSVLTFP